MNTFSTVLQRFGASGVIGVAMWSSAVAAQGPAPRGRGAAAVKPAAPAAAAVSRADATLLQLMRGILYPASNVIFAAQDDLGKLVQPPDPSVSPNPLTSTYGGWTAVENAGLALAEAAKLVMI